LFLTNLHLCLVASSYETLHAENFILLSISTIFIQGEVCRQDNNSVVLQLNHPESLLGCVFVLDVTDFLVIVFVVAPVFFGARTKNMIRKFVPSSTKT
jgi:hypothetical protein